MFRVKEANILERRCPNGHTPLLDLLPESNLSVRFCPVCGRLLEERQVTYDAAYCSNCNNRVAPGWDYCPYCGRIRG